MKQASITEAKNRLSALIDRVREGETVWITDRGRPVARLEPVNAQPGNDPAGTLSRLERAGIVRKGLRTPPLALIEQPGPRIAAGESMVRVLIEERSEGR
jgi:prevent-host-death family protein